MWQQRQQLGSVASRACPITCPHVLSKGRTVRCRSQQEPLGSEAAHQTPQITDPEQAPKVPGAVARSILARRSVVEEDALHRPLGLVLFGSYVLGSAASIVGKLPALQSRPRLPATMLSQPCSLAAPD